MAKKFFPDEWEKMTKEEMINARARLSGFIESTTKKEKTIRDASMSRIFSPFTANKIGNLFARLDDEGNTSASQIKCFKHLSLWQRVLSKYQAFGHDLGLKKGLSDIQDFLKFKTFGLKKSSGATRKFDFRGLRPWPLVIK
jgi:hypothetical protein